MPNWVRHTFWALLALILLSHWRAVGGWVADAFNGIAGLFRGDWLGFDDPVYRFAVFGVLMVALVAVATVYFRSRGDKKP